MKRSILTFGAVTLLGLGALSGCGKSSNSDYRVAMVSDFADITDESFNQSTYEGGKEWCDANNVDFIYYRPTDDSDLERIRSIELAIDKGYNIILVAGYAFSLAIEDVATRYPDVKFIVIDVSKSDLLAAHFEDYDYNPDNPKWASYEIPSNVYCAIYREEISGFMAGYAAVKEGYTKLGFLGGMAVPAVMRFGYGYLQGIDAAAEGKKVDVNYVYSGQFKADTDTTTYVSQWYNNGTEVIFACGGPIYTSVGDAAKNHGGGVKIIGADTDQSRKIDNDYGKGVTLTSAVKGIRTTIKTKLNEIIAEDEWKGGIVENLGIVSADDPNLNYVQLPTETWSMTKFTIDDYKDLVRKIYNGEITISDNIANKPTLSTTTKVTYFENIH